MCYVPGNRMANNSLRVNRIIYFPLIFYLRGRAPKKSVRKHPWLPTLYLSPSIYYLKQVSVAEKRKTEVKPSFPCSPFFSRERNLFDLLFFF